MKLKIVMKTSVLLTTNKGFVMCAFTDCPNSGEIVQNGYCVCPIGHLVHNGACTSKSHWFDHGLHSFIQIMN